MEVKSGFWDPDKVSLSPELRCPFNRGNKYKGYVNICKGPDFVFPEWRFSLNRGVSKNRCHCMLNKFTSRFGPPLFSKYTALQAVLTFLSLQTN